MARLRAPDGCPWDQEQTHQSIARCLVEEASEVLEAIDTENPELLREELGYRSSFMPRLKRRQDGLTWRMSPGRFPKN
jgi:hypothetical protein